MYGLNRVELIGHLGRDPELRYTVNGMAIATVSLATKEKPRSNSSTQEMQTEWHAVVLYGRLAELCGQFLSSGSPVYIDGRLKTRRWKDRNGHDHQQTEIIGDRMLMLSQRQTAETAPEGLALPQNVSGKTEIDIPF